MLFPRTLAHVSDPMSGFFAVRTAAVNPAALRPRGFKILLELLIRTPRLVVAEVPFTFAERHDGQSKASWQEGARYLRQLAVLRLATAGRAGRLPRVDGQLPSQPGTGHPGQAPIAVIPAQAPSAAIPAQAPSAAIPTSRRVA